MSQAYHFIGIGGIGMSGLARLLLGQKATVSGSDIAHGYTIDGLIKAGATVYQGHSADHISPKMTVVYSSDIKKDNPEYLSAIQKQCTLLHRSNLLSQLVEGHTSLAVAGSHGKTTTSALLATVLVETGQDPSFAVGGLLTQYHANSRFGEGEYFAFEADESDGTFLNYHPFGAIVTNIDNDHLIAFEGSKERLIEAFQTFMTQVSSTKHLFWCGDDIYLKQLNHPGQRYGFSPDCDWRALNFRQEGFSIVFDIQGAGQYFKDVEVHLTGKHNALNALAVFALTYTLGIEEKKIRDALKKYQGVMRRCEKKGESHSILFLDDYAHHPTEIEVTLKAVRKAIRERRLVAVFQPHRYSRIQDCLGQFGSIFDSADELIITDIFPAGEKPISGITHSCIEKEVDQRSSIPLCYVPRDELTQFLTEFVQPHDVVVTLGAGDITKVGPEVLSNLEKRPPKPIQLGLIFGGSFSEHEVSIRSSQHFRESLRRDIYAIEEFGITKQGTWLNGLDAKQQLERLLNAKSKNSSSTPLSEAVLQIIKQCQVLIPVLHGPLGEDGTIQGFFEMLDKAYVGCDHRSAAIAMDKALCKKLAILQGLRTAPFVDFSTFQWENQAESIKSTILQQLIFPVSVKPIHLGSTVGVRKVNRPEELEEAIHYAFGFDDHLVVENGIVNCRELEFAVLGNDEVQVFPPGEIITNGAVYDYSGKYSSHSMPTTPCAELSPALVEEGKKLAVQAYQAIGCCGMARVDFFLDPKGVYWFNEINPIPGFTALSLYPQICAHNGLKGPELMDRLIILALHRKRKQERIKQTET